MPNDLSNKDHSMSDLLKGAEKKTQVLRPTATRLSAVVSEIRQRLLPSIYRPGVHTPNHLRAAGFEYTGHGDTARCTQCGFEVSNWTSDMNPFTIHLKEKPHCPFNRSLRESSTSPITTARNIPVTSEQGNLSERISIETNESNSSSNVLSESDLLRQVRRRTFSHWSHQGALSSEHMTDAGFFNCNNGDRVLCIYCNLICQHWTPHVDDPCEVHRTISPNCIYVRALLTRRTSPHIINYNGCSMNPTASSSLSRSNNINSVRVSQFVRPPAQNNIGNTISNNLPVSSTSSNNKSPSVDDMIQADYFNTNVKNNVICEYCNGALRYSSSSENPMIDHARRFPNCPGIQQLRGTRTHRHIPESRQAQQERDELIKRRATFAGWPNQNLPSPDILARAGFFYTGTNTSVTCSYCNGSLHHWRPNDNPVTEHARWFPHCSYVKQLHQAAIYRQMQESQPTQQGHVAARESNENVDSDNTSGYSARLLIPDESTLSRLVAARLDLPISQSLLQRNFQLSIIQRCWEDQLRLKNEGFVTDADFKVACLVLKKQIEHIDVKKESVVIPSERMTEIREQAEREQIEILAQRRAIPRSTSSAAIRSHSTDTTNNTDVHITTSQTSVNSTLNLITNVNQEQTEGIRSTTNNVNHEQQPENSTPSNPCVLCLAEEKRLACLPCGHLATCVPCGHSLRSCPVCRKQIEAFVRIHI